MYRVTDRLFGYIDYVDDATYKRLVHLLRSEVIPKSEWLDDDEFEGFMGFEPSERADGAYDYLSSQFAERPAAYRALLDSIGVGKYLPLAGPLKLRSDSPLELARIARSLEPGEVAVFIRPQSDENARLINQCGLFTRLPDTSSARTLEDQIRACFPDDHDEVVLLRIPLKNCERIEILRDLNRMNIHRASLFPDLSGAGRYCNMVASVYDQRAAVGD